MGGVGSSRWLDTDVRPLVDEYQALDVRALARLGGLRDGARTVYRRRGATEAESDERGRVTVSCRGDEITVAWWPDDNPALVVVPLAFTTTGTGGRCPWLRCPGCRRRAARLYLFGWALYCRRCLRLSYATEREDRWDLAARRARRARRRLGLADGDLLAPLPGRPRGMHDDTYAHLRQQAVWADLLWAKAIADDAAATFRRGKRRLQRRGLALPDWLPLPKESTPEIEAAAKELERAIRAKRKPRRGAAA